MGRAGTRTAGSSKDSPMISRTERTPFADWWRTIDRLILAALGTLMVAGINVQPSEFLKPAFVVLIAWLFGESARRPEMPANTVALGLFFLVVGLLVLQPDFGQTMLIAMVWSALFFMAGMRWVWVVGLA